MPNPLSGTHFYLPPSLSLPEPIQEGPTCPRHYESNPAENAERHQVRQRGINLALITVAVPDVRPNMVPPDINRSVQTANAIAARHVATTMVTASSNARESHLTMRDKLTGAVFPTSLLLRVRLIIWFFVAPFDQEFGSSGSTRPPEVRPPYIGHTRTCGHRPRPLRALNRRRSGSSAAEHPSAISASSCFQGRSRLLFTSSCPVIPTVTPSVPRSTFTHVATMHFT